MSGTVDFDMKCGVGTVGTMKVLTQLYYLAHEHEMNDRARKVPENIQINIQMNLFLIQFNGNLKASPVSVCEPFSKYVYDFFSPG